MFRLTGAVLFTPGMLRILATAYGALGRVAEGLNCLTEAAQIIDRTEERWDESQIFRMRGIC